MSKKKEQRIDRNLKNLELTSGLLRSSILVSKYLRETLWKESISPSDLSNLKSVTKILEDSISKIVPDDIEKPDPNQLELFETC